jgi:hypothetical protein
MTFRRIRLVAWHVFKESVRDRVLYGIGAFAVLLVKTSKSSRISACRRSNLPVR